MNHTVKSSKRNYQYCKRKVYYVKPFHLIHTQKRKLVETEFVLFAMFIVFAYAISKGGMVYGRFPENSDLPIEINMTKVPRGTPN